MLVLSRKTSETIVIGDEIELTVIALGRGRVKLGITAPKDVPIRRSELDAQFGPPFATIETARLLLKSDENACSRSHHDFGGHRPNSPEFGY